ncbi:MAG TPA: bifunctional diguanylate cyclase/phosphodiesterase [Stellaceae bacterium]|nr:bifunctional diguanylate cyclase/phosphodiesterase [Stellaceae bacterium]
MIASDAGPVDAEAMETPAAAKPSDRDQQSRDQQSRIEDRVNYDELTGHFNRTRLREAIDRAINDGMRRPGVAAFLALGVDNMSAINERFGRMAADTVLVELGRRLDACLRVSDLVGRLGGDRYGILLPHCPDEYVPVAAEKILETVRAAPFATERGTVSATVSIGAASFCDRGATSYEVITRAEAALADAKRTGRNCHVHYRSSEEQRAHERRCAAIGDAVRAALRQDRVGFAFQPVVSAATGDVDYYECLLRLRDASGAFMAAGDFIQEIERFGYIRLVDRYILDRVLVEAGRHPHITFGFNISALTTADRSWLRSLTGRLRGNPGLARRLVVEITETAALYDIEESARFVDALRRAGCRVALDDFGAGHTSLQHLQSLKVDMVKVDRAFISDITTNGESQVFLRHLLGLAKGFGFATIAEGVETEDEAAILRREGVGFLQGHLYGIAALDPPWLQPAA